LHELFDGHAGVGDDSSERAGSNLPVVGDDGAGVRLVAAEDHVAAALAAEAKSGALEGGTDLGASEAVGRLDTCCVHK
jgi:hypothetical protein